MTSTARIEAVRRALDAWYRRHSRDLPWRRTSHPYAIWLSETMLQQTQVRTVIPYWRGFLERFPDVRALARAPLDDVLKAWEGLGYYSRARNLHRAAKMIVDELHGNFPRTTEGWLTLPGVGRYTAGAIVSIAFGGDEPVLDGNVIRVLCRVFLIRDDPRTAVTQKKLWKLAEQLVRVSSALGGEGQGEGAGHFNQAVMDLGAMVCVPRKPACGRCPLESLCEARRKGEERSLPRKSGRKPVPHQDVVVAVIRRRGRLLIDRRRPEGLLGGLWEFPGGKPEKREGLKAALVRELREELGVEVAVGRHIVNVDHAYTHLRVTLHAFEATLLSGRPRALACDALKWVRFEELDRYAFPAATLKIIDVLKKRRRP